MAGDVPVVSWIIVTSLNSLQMLQNFTEYNIFYSDLLPNINHGQPPWTGHQQHLITQVVAGPPMTAKHLGCAEYNIYVDFAKIPWWLVDEIEYYQKSPC